MVDGYRSYRNSKGGIVLISTLISLILVISLAMVLQSAAIANTRTIKALETRQSTEPLIDSGREMARPHFAAVFLGEEKVSTRPVIRLAFDKYIFEISTGSEGTDQLEIRKITFVKKANQ